MPIGSIEAKAVTSSKNRQGLAGRKSLFLAAVTPPTQGIPQTPAELPNLLSFTYDLTVSRAGELGVPVAGNVSGGFNRRVIIYEWTRYKGLVGDDGAEYRFGYVIRFCLTVSKWDIQTKLSLPFLSAQAELGNLQASWLMQVRGLNGSKIDAVVLPPQELKVETFVIARQSLNAVIEAISDPSTLFIPGTVVAKIDPATPEAEIWSSAVRAYAAYSVSRGRTAMAAKSEVDSSDTAAMDVITETYQHFGVTDDATSPPRAAREAARLVLRGITADT